jgi:carboxyl-terminal processing protease
VSKHDDPSWYEQQFTNDQTPSNDQASSPESQPAPDDFDHYPFLPGQDANNPNNQGQTALAAPDASQHHLQRTIGRAIALIALIVIAFWGGWFSQQYYSNNYFNQNDKSQAYEKLFQQAWDDINQNYVDRSDINYQKMSYAAINAMVTTLGDTGHTRFMDASTAQSENQQLSGQFSGIGIYLQQDPKTKQLIVTSPIPGSPAEKAGIKPNDIITAVNGKSTAGEDVAGLTTMIQGKNGTTVAITVQRPSVNKSFTFNIKRAVINVPNVLMYYIPQDHTAQIQIVQFANGVSDQVKTDVLQAKSEGATKIVLDLRDNPGGYLQEAQDTASLFIKSGHVLIQEDSKGDKTPLNVTGNPIDTTTPMVVLVNGNSASAAEIVAAALKENGRATLIGEKTYGTGTVLQAFNLADGSELLIGTQEWLTPDGQFIRNKGITPNITVAMPSNGTILTPTDEAANKLSEQQILKSTDTQLVKALEYQK